MRLSELLRDVNAISVQPAADPEITAIVDNSREAVPGALFVAIRGHSNDGNEFVTEAVSRGAHAIVSERQSAPAPEWDPLPGEPAVPLPAEMVWVRVEDARKALSVLAANFYGRPADRLEMTAVTGTNGKTTVSFLIDAIFSAAGRKGGLFGTIFHRTPAGQRPAATTTPDALELQQYLSEVAAKGGSYAVLEASSHALAQERLWGCHFAAAVFTNLTRDHLDYHENLESYFAAKRRLFEGTGAGAPDAGIVNLDDAYGARLAGLAGKTITYGLSERADVTTKHFAATPAGLEFIARTPAGPVEVHSRLAGRMNVYNILAAIGCGIALEIPRQAIEAGIRQLERVPGRFEKVELGQPFLVIVDFAHTDDALQNVLATARELHPGGRLITLFGCGGNRDRTKRPAMGEVAGRLSDVVILTSDNPRNEDPLCIINDTLVGLQRTEATALVEADRRRAIGMAMDEARAGDVVVLAGKGHEKVQVLKSGPVPFDDAEVAREALRARGYDG